ncbi:MAG: DUF1467 family protein [Paracoccaceae bacterium]
MSITSALVFFAVIWVLIFLMLLPLWQTTQEEAGEIEPGTPGSAPLDMMLKKKARWTTLWAVLVFAAAYAVIEIPLVTLEDVSWITPPSLR